MLKHPEAFTIYHVKNDEDLRNHCWSVDSQEDFAFVEAIFDLAAPYPEGVELNSPG